MSRPGFRYFPGPEICGAVAHRNPKILSSINRKAQNMPEKLSFETPLSDGAQALLRRARAGLWPIPHPPSQPKKDDREDDGDDN